METIVERMTNHLQTLKDSDYEMKGDQPDIRGWKVKNASAQLVGKVDELLFDVAKRRVRYLIVNFEINELGLDNRMALVPIGLAEMHEADDEVILPNVTIPQLSALHPYQPADFDSDTENSVLAAFVGAAGIGGYVMPVTQSFYEHEHFNEENLYTRRRKGTEADDDTALFPINEDLEDRVDMPSSEHDKINGVVTNI